jgi:hypothetical protein
LDLLLVIVTVSGTKFNNPLGYLIHGLEQFEFYKIFEVDKTSTALESSVCEPKPEDSCEHPVACP